MKPVLLIAIVAVAMIGVMVPSVFADYSEITITPMLSSLSLMESANSESEVLGLGLSVIMVNIGMYLGVPAMIVIGIKKKF